MKRYKHSLSHYNLTTMNMGKLIPIGCVEVLPGDTFRHATSAFIRVSPLQSPVMHPVTVRIHHWFVPYRIIWDDFEKFITGGPDGMDASSVPYFNVAAANNTVGSLFDYFGLPTGVDLTVAAGRRLCSLPIRAYNKIWNEFYRDQDLQTERTVPTTSGSDASLTFSVADVNWEKDYFTTARPWTQKGPDIQLTLTPSTAPVYMAAVAGSDVGVVSTAQSNLIKNLVASTPNVTLGTTTTPVGNDLRADLSLLGIKINDLREAIGLQRYEEMRARYGSRFVEYLRSLGVRSSDARLQRPEYLGGGKQTIQFSEVLQTGVTTSGTAGTGVGTMKGHGVTALRSNRYLRFFEEHGLVITLMSVLPKTIYAQSMHKMWGREIKEDFWQRELERIGQAPVLNKEVYGPHSAPTQVFGYQDRYDEYRRHESRVTGEFRSTLTDWHMARIFSSDPALNSSFVAANPTNRIYQSTATHQLYCLVNHSLQARRLVSPSGTPAGLF